MKWAFQVLRISLPKLDVTCSEATGPILVAKTATRKSPTPGLDGKDKVNQLAADRLPSRGRAPGEACVQIADPLMWPSKDPMEDGGCSYFCFSSPHGRNSDHWVIPPCWLDGADGQAGAVAGMIIYPALVMIWLTVCENRGCVLKNFDGVEESESAESTVMLCPTCFRTLKDASAHRGHHRGDAPSPPPLSPGESENRAVKARSRPVEQLAAGCCQGRAPPHRGSNTQASGSCRSTKVRKWNDPRTPRSRAQRRVTWSCSRTMTSSRQRWLGRGPRSRPPWSTTTKQLTSGRSRWSSGPLSTPKDITGRHEVDLRVYLHWLWRIADG